MLGVLANVESRPEARLKFQESPAVEDAGDDDVIEFRSSR